MSNNSFFLDAFKGYDHGIGYKRMRINVAFWDKSRKLICIKKAFNIHSKKNIVFFTRQSTLIYYNISNYGFLRVVFDPLNLQKSHKK